MSVTEVFLTLLYSRSNNARHQDVQNVLLLLELFVFAVVYNKTDLFSRFVPICVHNQNDLEQNDIRKLVLLLSVKPKCLARRHSFALRGLVVYECVVRNRAVANR